MATDTVVEARVARALRLTPAQTIVVGFAATMLAGAAVLALPLSSAQGTWTPPLVALFTAVSATAVTGLVVVDTATHFSTVGELVILILIQVGGLGYMTAAALIPLLLGRRIGLPQRVALQEAYNLDRPGGVVRFTRLVVTTTLAIEVVGTLLLAVRFVPEMGWGRGGYYALFHAISAFNNAGFDLFGGFRSLTAYVGDVWVNATMAMLIVVGGLGFLVVQDLRARRLSLHSKIALATSAALLIFGFAAVFAIEYSNPETLGSLPLGTKVLASAFQAITPRTAGFNTLPVAEMREGTLAALVPLMFIGASPGGTGGGIKTVTFSVLLAAIITMVRGRQDVEAFRRRLPPVQIYKALTIALVAVAVVMAMAIALTVVEGLGFLHALFEVTSALGTVGLSPDITPSLGAAGQALIIATIFIGRVGLLTMAFALAGRQRPVSVRYAEERVIIG